MSRLNFTFFRQTKSKEVKRRGRRPVKRARAVSSGRSRDEEPAFFLLFEMELSILKKNLS